MNQRQDSLEDQMRDVIRAAVEMGCYDAQEWVVRRWNARGEEALRTIGAHNHDGVGRFARSVIEKGTT